MVKIILDKCKSLWYTNIINKTARRNRYVDKTY